MSTDNQWKKWGQQDPYYGVYSHARFRGKTLDGAVREEFFLLGEAEISKRLALIEKYYGSVAKRTAVDFGCGVGRLMVSLGRHYEKIVGVDISPDMIAEAKINCAAYGITSTEFFQAANDIASNSADLVNSSIVFQHIPVKRGLLIIEALLEVLTSGGVASIHVTTSRKLSFGKELVYQIKNRFPYAHILFNILQGKKIFEPTMMMNSYPLDRVIDIFCSKAMTEIVVLPVFEGAQGYIVMGRRAPRSV